MNLGQRFSGVFTSPRETFTGLAEKPVWVDALIIVLMATILYSFLIAPYAAKDNYELMQQSTKLRERVGEERFKTMLEDARKKAEEPTTGGRLQQGLMAGIFSLIAIFIQTLILLVLSKFFSTQGSYQQLLSSMFHANFINGVLGNAVRFGLASAKHSVFKISTGLAVFFPHLEPTSNTYIILTSIDLFQLWMFGVLGYALSAIFKLDLKKSLVISYLFWALKTVVNIALAIWGTSFTR
jgi:hypothetical protein